MKKTKYGENSIQEEEKLIKIIKDWEKGWTQTDATKKKKNRRE